MPTFGILACSGAGVQLVPGGLRSRWQNYFGGCKSNQMLKAENDFGLYS
jgi:hypothetical protein